MSDDAPNREQLLFSLYEAAELEHNLMCTYLYAIFSLRDSESEGLRTEEAEIIRRWRGAMLKVAIDEMGHLAAVWNITAALGGSPRFGRANFPLDPGYLPAGVVVKLAPFNDAVLQHFVYLERPEHSTESDGEGFAPEIAFTRGGPKKMLTPMAVDYDTVGTFYASLSEGLGAFTQKIGESAAFCGDPALQLAQSEVALFGAKPVICSKTALAAFQSIIEQGEGASEHSKGSHYARFAEIREEYRALKAKNPDFTPAFPAAVNPVLRRPMRPQGRVWLEDELAVATVDLANSCYALMLRLMAYAYVVPRPEPEKALAIDLSLGLMRAMTLLGEQAARLPAGPSNPGCNAGMSFTALRDAAPFPRGAAARAFYIERLGELARAGDLLAKTGLPRLDSAARMLDALSKRCMRGFSNGPSIAPAASPAPKPAPANGKPPEPVRIGDVEEIEGKDLTLLYEGKKCIHSRFCVTWGPNVFLANVEGPWIHPDAMSTDGLVEIAHVCPSGAIRYRRKDGKPDEAPPPVNLLAVREAGPYAFRGDLSIDGEPVPFRVTLCRCGASKNKPYCDGSHHEVNFAATGEPVTGQTDMLPKRDGPLAIDPEIDGPLQVRGNLEITSGTGRLVTRLVQTRLCRCGGSATKPYCDGTHARIGFRST